MIGLVVVCIALACACAGLTAWCVVLRRRERALVTQQQRLRELIQQRVERPDVFGHEVRTPLALINGAAELLAEQTPGPLNDRQREFVNTIATNSRQVIAMAEDLLTEVHLQSELFELRAARIELRGLVRDAVREVRRIAQPSLRLLDQGAPLWIDGDPDLLRQALWNLVNNAVRHAGADATVTVEVLRGEGEAVVTVSDNGAGMSAAERERLFDAYVVGSSRRPGTGLGMMITQRIVTLHRGRVLVDTAPGGGTAILVALPLPDDDRTLDDLPADAGGDA